LINTILGKIHFYILETLAEKKRIKMDVEDKVFGEGFTWRETTLDK